MKNIFMILFMAMSILSISACTSEAENQEEMRKIEEKHFDDTKLREQINKKGKSWTAF